MKMRWFVLAILLAVTPAVASDRDSCNGCIDTSFGATGRVLVGFDLGQDNRDVGNRVTRVPGTGQLFIVGQIATATAGDSDYGVLALTADGVPDVSFDGDGLLDLDMSVLPAGQDAGRDIAVIQWPADSSWRLVVVGDIERVSAGDRDFGVALVRPDGALETSAGGGRAVFHFDQGDDNTDVAAAVAIDTQGRIVVAGTVDTGAGATDWGFLRLTAADLALDGTFAGGGQTVVAIDGLAVLRDIAIQPDGKIIAVGTRDFGDDQFAVVRLDANGALDTSFGFLGTVIVDPDLGDGNEDDAFSVALRPDGKIVVVGQSSQDAGPGVGNFLTVVRLNEDGTLDTTFQGQGWWSYMPPSYCDGYEGRGVHAFPSGRIAIGAASFCDGTWDYSLIDLSPGGDALSSLVVDFYQGTTEDDRLTDILVQPDGKLVAVGRSTSSGDDLDFSAVRQWTEVIFSDGFEASGWNGADWDQSVN